MTYLLQITTKDLGLMLKTEVTASSVSELKTKSKEMVKNNINVVGTVYRIFKYIKNTSGKFESFFLKEGVLKGDSND